MERFETTEDGETKVFIRRPKKGLLFFDNMRGVMTNPIMKKCLGAVVEEDENMVTIQTYGHCTGGRIRLAIDPWMDV